MSILINSYRKWARYKGGETVFGQICESEDPLGADPSELSPFDIKLKKLKFRLQQACRRGDFGETFATGLAVDYEQNSPEDTFHKLVTNFNTQTSIISAALQCVTPHEAENWLEENEDKILQMINCLDEIYKHRKCSIIWLERILNIAEPLFAVLALVGLAAGIMKLAGTGILGGAFAHYATPETTIGIVKVTGLTSLSVAGFCTLFCTEKHNLRSSISESIEKKRTISSP